MAKILTEITETGESTNLVPLGGEDAITRKGDRWAEGGDVLLRSEYPEYSTKFPDNLTTVALDETNLHKLNPLTPNNNILELSSGRLIMYNSAPNTNISFSDDGGNTWTNAISKISGIIQIIMVSSGRLIASSGSHVSYSDDGGVTWISNVINSPAQTKMFETSNGNIIIMGGAHMRHSANNGVTWTTPVTGLPNNDDVIITSNGNLVVWNTAGSTPSIATSIDNGLNWSTYSSPINGISKIVEMTTGTLIAGSKIQNNYERSTDNGLTWITGALNIAKVSEIVEMSTGTIVLAAYGSSSSVEYSTDDGLTWGVRAPSLTGGGMTKIGLLPNGSLYAIKAASTPKNFAHTPDPATSGWANKTTGLLGITSIFTLQNGDIIALNISSDEIVKSFDSGDNWESVQLFATDISHIIEITNAVLLIDTMGTGNIQYSLNNGESWDLLTTSINLSTGGSFDDPTNFLIESSNHGTTIICGDNKNVKFWTNNPNFVYIEPPTVVTNLVRVK